MTACRRLVIVGAAVAAATLCALGSEPAGAAADPPVAAHTVDGFRLGNLPKNLGPQVSDFDYEYEGVGFRARVWERGPDASGAHHVDLRVVVLRGERLTDPEALREFLAEYLERDPQRWELQRYDRAAFHGFAEAGRVFFLARPGVAVHVATPEGSGVSPDELTATADGIETAPG